MKFAFLIEPPFNYREGSGGVVGHDVEIARHIFQVLGESFEPIETEFAQLLPGLARGDWQMTTGLFATEERRRSAAFTHPIWVLPDGLLVQRGNPSHFTGYHSVAQHDTALLAVVRDQFQHRSAVEFGVPEQRLRIFETYREAAAALHAGQVDAYASVGRAHVGFIAQNPSWDLDCIEVPYDEKPPAFGAFAVSPHDSQLLERINDILAGYLGCPSHRRMAGEYGFSNAEVDLVASG